ncbi:MAG: holo-ACP synthase [Parachlamydiaceae bacterium]|nr:holo-ACP synthase [Parachlamydiaceae bacterium]
MRGLGTDIIEIERIRASIAHHQQHFLDKIFTAGEQSYCHKYNDSTPHFAGRFAAKEAVIKALGSGFRSDFSWLDIEILNDSEGKPEVFLAEGLRIKFGNPNILISISHCREYATATALFY